MRAGGTSQTTLNYTGQRLDGTGLLFYNARYYDPVIGRFISADTVVPGNASGGMDGVALRPLTVAFHEPGFIATLNGEGANADKLHWGGPVNPQALNRYSYVMNNPIRWTDPSGHCGAGDCAVGGAVVGGTVGGPVGAVVGGAIGTTADILVILGIAAVGGAWLADLNSTRTFVQTKPVTSLSTKYESRWRDRESDVGPVRVRKLKDSEVRGDVTVQGVSMAL